MRQFFRAFFFILAFPLAGMAQGLDQNWEIRPGFSFGLNLDIHVFGLRKRENASAIRFFAGAFCQARYKDGLLLNASLSGGVYKRTLGNSTNPSTNDTQMDLILSGLMGWSQNKASQETKFIRTAMNIPVYNLIIKEHSAFMAGSNWIWNNHGRNQACGSIVANFQNVSLHYFNDGGPPIDQMGTGDNFDRWWTGSGALYWHGFRQNRVEIGFDQFTGFSGLLYEMSNLLGLELPNYKPKDGQDNSTYFNSSAYYLRAFVLPGVGFHVGVHGNLYARNSAHLFGIQDIIHNKMNFSLHSNEDTNRPFIGLIVQQPWLYSLK